MASLMTQWYIKDAKRRAYYLSFYFRKRILRSLMYSDFFSSDYRLCWYLSFLNMPKNSSKSVYRRGCVLTGDSTSVFRFFKISRYCFKRLADHGSLQGLRKASF